MSNPEETAEEQGVFNAYMAEASRSGVWPRLSVTNDATVAETPACLAEIYGGNPHQITNDDVTPVSAETARLKEALRAEIKANIAHRRSGGDIRNEIARIAGK